VSAPRPPVVGDLLELAGLVAGPVQRARGRVRVGVVLVAGTRALKAAFPAHDPTPSPRLVVALYDGRYDLIHAPSGRVVCRSARADVALAAAWAMAPWRPEWTQPCSDLDGFSLDATEHGRAVMAHCWWGTHQQIKGWALPAGLIAELHVQVPQLLQWAQVPAGGELEAQVQAALGELAVMAGGAA